MSFANHIQTHGLILYTQNYLACLAFYRDTLELPVWFEKPPGLCCLRFGDGYLMVEDGGVAHDSPKPVSANPTVIRFNVAAVDAAMAVLSTKGITVQRQSFDWGEVATFLDPDGNICELKNHFDGDFQPEPK